MDDLISREAALVALGECPYNWNDWPEEIQAVDDWESHKEAIENTPAVDAVPVVHARWRELKDGTEECTNCLGLCPYEENYNGDVIFNFGCEYCPWCGAKMDGRNENG